MPRTPIDQTWRDRLLGTCAECKRRGRWQHTHCGACRWRAAVRPPRPSPQLRLPFPEWVFGCTRHAAP